MLSKIKGWAGDQITSTVSEEVAYTRLKKSFKPVYMASRSEIRRSSLLSLCLRKTLFLVHFWLWRACASLNHQVPQRYDKAKLAFKAFKQKTKSDRRTKGASKRKFVCKKKCLQMEWQSWIFTFHTSSKQEIENYAFSIDLVNMV